MGEFGSSQWKPNMSWLESIFLWRTAIALFPENTNRGFFKPVNSPPAKVSHESTLSISQRSVIPISTEPWKLNTHFERPASAAFSKSSWKTVRKGKQRKKKHNSVSLNSYCQRNPWAKSSSLDCSSGVAHHSLGLTVQLPGVTLYEQVDARRGACLLSRNCPGWMDEEKQMNHQGSQNTCLCC